MTAGVPGGQQDLDDFQKQRFTSNTWKKGGNSMFYQICRMENLLDFQFPTLYVTAEHSMRNSTSV